MLSKAKVAAIHADLDAAMKAVALKHGLVASPSRIVYNAETFKLTAEFGDKEATGGVDPKHLNNMKKHGWKFDLEVTDIGRKYNHPSVGEVEVIGMHSNQKVAIRVVTTGKAYVVPAAAAARLLGKKPGTFADLTA